MSRKDSRRGAGETSFEPLEARCLLTTVFYDSFGGPPGEFLNNGWSRTSNQSSYQWSESTSSGNNTLFCASLNGSQSSNTYPNSLDTTFSRTIDMRQYEAARLGFWLNVDTETGWDYFTVHVNGEELPNARKSGATGWQYQQFDLHAGYLRQNTEFKFIFHSDGSVTDAGVWIDDILVTGLQPDLGAVSFDATPEDVFSGTKLQQISFSIRNFGDARARDDFWVRLVLSGDRWIGDNDLKLKAIKITANFAKGQTRTFTVRNIELPAQGAWAPLDRGHDTYYFGLMIDVQDDIAESNENNNRNRGLGRDKDAIEVFLPSNNDLVGVHFNSVENLTIGGYVPPIQFTVVNQGRATVTENFYVQIMLSGDRWIGQYDISLGRAFISENLSPGETITRSIQVRNLPQAHNWGPWSGPGRYYLGMWIDRADRVFEQFENNNKGRRDGWDRDQVFIGSSPPMPDPDTRRFGHTDGLGDPGGRPDNSRAPVFEGPGGDSDGGSAIGVWRLDSPRDGRELDLAGRARPGPVAERFSWTGAEDAFWRLAPHGDRDEALAARGAGEPGVQPLGLSSFWNMDGPDDLAHRGSAVILPRWLDG